jgi:prefoldin subunit 5
VKDVELSKRLQEIADQLRELSSSIQSLADEMLGRQAAHEAGKGSLEE